MDNRSWDTRRIEIMVSMVSTAAFSRIKASITFAIL